MKNLALVFGLFICTAFSFAQEVQPVGEQINENTLKVTYFHSNGKVMHQGNYIDGKSDGLWKSYNEAGSLIAEGSFDKGKKTGLWNFYSGNTLSAVLYSDNAIAEVKKFNRNTLAEK